MSIADISLFSALLAGALSFLSPCVLPLVPPYLCYMAGISVEQFKTEDAAPRPEVRKAVLVSAFFFTLGFATVFVALGAGASTIGTLLRQNLDILAKIGGFIIILMGLNFLGVFRIGVFSREARFQGAGKPATLSGAYVMGLAFAFAGRPASARFWARSSVLPLRATRLATARRCLPSILLALRCRSGSRLLFPVPSCVSSCASAAILVLWKS